MFPRRSPLLDDHNDALTCVWIVGSLLRTYLLEKPVDPLIQISGLWLQRVVARKVRSALTQILAECLFVAVVLPSARIIIRVWLHFIVKFHVVKH